MKPRVPGRPCTYNFEGLLSLYVPLDGFKQMICAVSSDRVHREAPPRWAVAKIWRRERGR